MTEENHESFKYLVTIKDSKTVYPRTFVIGSLFYQTVREYVDLRPTKGLTTSRFFLFYSKGKCTVQPIGKNRFGQTPGIIALYLNLKNYKEFTGHSFRRTAATLLSNSGANLVAVKSLGGWKSDTVCQGYVDNSLSNKDEIFRGIVNSNKSLRVLSAQTLKRKPGLDIERDHSQAPETAMNEIARKKHKSSSSNISHVLTAANQHVVRSSAAGKTTCTITSATQSNSTSSTGESHRVTAVKLSTKDKAGTNEKTCKATSISTVMSSLPALISTSKFECAYISLYNLLLYLEIMIFLAGGTATCTVTSVTQGRPILTIGNKCPQVSQQVQKPDPNNSTGCRRKSSCTTAKSCSREIRSTETSSTTLNAANSETSALKTGSNSTSAMTTTTRSNSDVTSITEPLSPQNFLISNEENSDKENFAPELNLEQPNVAFSEDVPDNN
ncbi:hypothetical protein QAD02_021913 [Eretmocerus hayati]|uniref:Uncharacterized protein n=1 Tax=Eretmocerus hayati TaxID=131215 RepID=A0ACC2PU23_9HYME|nr:hypothetical protein QAD02_021913 [Eretmocerus hayati]